MTALTPCTKQCNPATCSSTCIGKIGSSHFDACLAAERHKLAQPKPGFSTVEDNVGGRRHSDDRGDLVDPELRAAFDHGFRVGIETAMKLYGGK